jgi:DNA modification methylase
MSLLVDDADLKLYLGDCLEAAPQLAGLADAIVTSPPYAGLRGALEPAEYVPWLAARLEAFLPVLKPQGSMMLNLGRTYRDGAESDYIERSLLAAQDLGWHRIDTLIWRKLNAHPFVAPCYLINEHEIVYWLAPRTNAYRNYGEETRRPPSPETVARRARGGLRGTKNRQRGGYLPKQRTDFNEHGVRPGSVFESAIGRNRDVDHDASMEMQLAEHLVRLACPPGGLVLDPFAGSGTTGLAARSNGRRSILIEIDPAHAEEARRRVAQQSLLAHAGVSP